MGNSNPGFLYRKTDVENTRPRVHINENINEIQGNIFALFDEKQDILHSLITIQFKINV